MTELAVDDTAVIHETALVEPGARVGPRTLIWNYSQVRAGATLGADCVLGKNIFVDTQVTVGDGCKLQNNCLLYQGLTLGNQVFVGPAATFTNDLVPRAFNSEWTITSTVVEDGASIGANATVICGNTLGEYSMVAAGSTVTKSVEPHQLVAGTPARHLGWVCRCGAVVSREAVAPSNLVCSSCQSEGTSK